LRGGGWLLAPALLLAGFSPFEAEERNVREGNERLVSGDAAVALNRYDDADREVGPRAEIDYDRGDALYRLGRLAEARETWRRALRLGSPPLSSRASQNIASALAAGGDREGAIAALVDALRADPANEDARFNLEVLLRQKEAADHRPDGQSMDSPQGRSGEKARSEEEGPGPKPSSRKPSPGALRPPETSADPHPASGTEEVNPEAADASSRANPPLTREEAERILDAFRSSERPLPRGGEPPRRRVEADRDW